MAYRMVQGSAPPGAVYGSVPPMVMEPYYGGGEPVQFIHQQEPVHYVQESVPYSTVQYIQQPPLPAPRVEYIAQEPVPRTVQYVISPPAQPEAVIKEEKEKPPPPDLPGQKKSYTCRNFCLIAMGLLILICAFVIFALPFYIANLPEKVLDKVCSNPRTSCTSNSAVKMNAPQTIFAGGYTADQQRICRADLKEFWGCKATPPKGLDPADYECTQMKQGDALVAELYDRWQTAMWLVGGFGGGVLILLVVIPAFIAACSTNSNVVLYCFGVNCFIWCFPYLFIGCCFYVLAVGMDPTVKWGPFNDPQLGVLAMSCAGDIGSNCGKYTWCQALLEVRGNTGIVAIASCCGVAFGVAGLTMFMGMFSCCCCTIDTKPVKIDPKKAKSTYKPPAPKIAPPEQRVIVYEEPPRMTQQRVIMTPPPLMVYGTPPPMAPPQVVYGTPPPQQFIYEQPQVVYEQPQVVYGTPPPQQFIYEQPQVVYEQPQVVYEQQPPMYEHYEPAFGPPGFGNPQVVYEGAPIYGGSARPINYGPPMY